MGVESWLKGLLGRADAAKADVAGKVADAAAEKALREAKEAAAKAGDALLDDLETALLGKKGAADEVNAREDAADPLERARAAYGLDAAKPAAEGTAREREERARAELAELKKKLGKA